MAEDEQVAILQALRNRDVTLHRETMATARSSGRRWTDSEDLELLERADEPAQVLAVDLGRTLFAVRSRPHVLRRRGQLGYRRHVEDVRLRVAIAVPKGNYSGPP